MFDCNHEFLFHYFHVLASIAIRTMVVAKEVIHQLPTPMCSRPVVRRLRRPIHTRASMVTAPSTRLRSSLRSLAGNTYTLIVNWIRACSAQWLYYASNESYEFGSVICLVLFTAQACGSENEQELLQNTYTNGASSICVDAANWQDYQSGMPDLKDCIIFSVSW